jgi:hypothetical protein
MLKEFPQMHLDFFCCISKPKLRDFVAHALQRYAEDCLTKIEHQQQELANRLQEYEVRRLKANDEKQAMFAQRRLANRRVYAHAVPVEAPGQPQIRIEPTNAKVTQRRADPKQTPAAHAPAHASTPNVPPARALNDAPDNEHSWGRKARLRRKAAIVRYCERRKREIALRQFKLWVVSFHRYRFHVTIHPHHSSVPVIAV